MSILLITILILLVICSGVLSGSETALFSLSKLKADVYEKDKSYKKRLVARLLKNPHELLVTILMANVAVNICVQNVVAMMVGNYSSWWLTIGTPFALTLIFGEVIPKSLGMSYNTKISPQIAPPIYGLKIIMMPFRLILTKISKGIAHFFFFFLRKDPDISLIELQHALETSQEKGVISLDESKLVQGALEVNDILIREVMCPRTDILYYSIHDPLDRLLHLFVDEECAQVPVIEDDINSVIGIITSSLYFLYREQIHQTKDLRKFLKKVSFIPEVAQARKLLGQFQKTEETIAMVVDEYGQISGLVTKEDIIEVIIGQIADKRDEKQLYTWQSNDVIISSGKLEMRALEEIFSVELLSSDNMVTLGGFLTEKNGDIPKSGFTYQEGNLLFRVLSSSDTRVQRVYIRKVSTKKGASV